MFKISPYTYVFDNHKEALDFANKSFDDFQHFQSVVMITMYNYSSGEELFIVERC